MKPATASMTIQGNTRAGFTLIELMAAMVVMAIGLFAIIQLQLVSIRGNSYAQERSNAQEIANGVAEEIMTQALGWVNLAPFGPNVTFGALFSPPLHTLILMNANPVPMGNQIPFGELQTLTMYRGNAIALGDTINTDGCSSLSTTNPECQNLGNIGRFYRVHYIAEAVPLTAGRWEPESAASCTHYGVCLLGQQRSWSAGPRVGQPQSKIDYWNRHMVSVTFFVRGKTSYARRLAMRLSKPAGFTLIELLVALVVSGLLMASLVGISGAVQKSFSRSKDTAELQSNLRFAMKLLVQDFRRVGLCIPRIRIRIRVQWLRKEIHAHVIARLQDLPDSVQP